MKALKNLVIFAAMLLPLTLSAQDIKENLKWTDLKNGIQTAYFQGELWGEPRYVAIVKYNPKRYSTQVLDAQRDQSASTDVLAARVGAKGAVNAGYFNMRELTPVTDISLDGKVLGRTTPGETFRVNGMVVIKDKKGHKISIEHREDATIDAIMEKSHAVISAGPLLLKDGVNQPGEDKGGFATGTHNRSVIGIDYEGNVWYIAVDGRFKDVCTGMSISDLTRLCRELGLKDALNLDGGGSTQVWTSVQGTLNHPSDNRRFDREGGRTVPNIIYFK